jgi:hypothetical protein
MLPLPVGRRSQRRRARHAAKGTPPPREEHEAHPALQGPDRRRGRGGGGRSLHAQQVGGPGLRTRCIRGDAECGGLRGGGARVDGDGGRQSGGPARGRAPEDRRRRERLRRGLPGPRGQRWRAARAELAVHEGRARRRDPPGARLEGAPRPVRPGQDRRDVAHARLRGQPLRRLQGQGHGPQGVPLRRVEPRQHGHRGQAGVHVHRVPREGQDCHDPQHPHPLLLADPARPLEPHAQPDRADQGQLRLRQEDPRHGRSLHPRRGRRRGHLGAPPDEGGRGRGRQAARVDVDSFEPDRGRPLRAQHLPRRQRGAHAGVPGGLAFRRRKAQERSRGLHQDHQQSLRAGR